jgi:16S rRNA processing protein RimM
MALEGYTPVGRVLRSFGVFGEVKVSLFVDFDTEPDNHTEGFSPVEAFFFDTPEGPLPYFVTHIRNWDSPQQVLKLEEINSKEEAQKLIGKTFYLPDEDVADTEEEGEFTYLIGYLMLNQLQEPVGVIQDIYVTTYQEIASVVVQDKEVLVPLHDELILEIKESEKQVVVDIPDGLLDIYMAS